jgi:hypothetical protein
LYFDESGGGLFGDKEPRESSLAGATSSRLTCQSFSRCAQAATHPKVYMLWNTTPPQLALQPRVAGGGTQVVFKKLKNTICDPGVPLLVAFYDPHGLHGDEGDSITRSSGNYFRGVGRGSKSVLCKLHL